MHKKIIIMGCSGAGKSTLSTGLALATGAHLMEEDWESNPYIPYLPERAFSCQWKQMETNYNAHLKYSRHVGNVVMDRSFLETFAFIKQYEDKLTPEEYEALILRYETLSGLLTREDAYCPKSKGHAVIYLKVSTATAINRITARGRVFESSINREQTSNWINNLESALEWEWNCSLNGRNNVDKLNNLNNLYVIDGEASREQILEEALKVFNALSY